MKTKKQAERKWEAVFKHLKRAGAAFNLSPAHFPALADGITELEVAHAWTMKWCKTARRRETSMGLTVAAIIKDAIHDAMKITKPMSPVGAAGLAAIEETIRRIITRDAALSAMHSTSARLRRQKVGRTRIEFAVENAIEATLKHLAETK